MNNASPISRAPRGIAGFFDGAGSFLSGLRLMLQNPQLILIALSPFVLTIALFVLLFVLCGSMYSGWQDYFLDEDAWWVTWTGLEYWLPVVAFLLFLMLAIVSFVTVGSLITSPFAEMLSQRVEAIRWPHHPRNAGGGIGTLVADILRGLKHEVIRLGIYLGLLIALAPVLFIPVVGQVTLIFLSIRYLAWDGLDYSMSRRRFGFRQKMAFLRQRRMRTVGYGSISFLLLMIPLTTLFVLPLNAIGGTLLFCRIVEDEQLDL